ncbi:hypothetical protein IM53_009125 [Xanthomonas phaseoli pv. dieffenbachiae]|uniref:Uncharacterized protein n=1 Tax=Xanthomonas phaseoli pv. dieffenbachiae TaxID=92828 RepID=A0A1V9HAX8_9XANT|nr:hypothetical protein IM53_009125 [Xanthomonas phaseoli pv. dieffenbachiae]
MDILVQASGRIEPPPWEAHIQHQCRTIAIRILIRHGVPEGFALQAPRPYRHIAGWVDDQTRATEVVGFDVVQLVGVRQQADR